MLVFKRVLRNITSIAYKGSGGVVSGLVTTAREPNCAFSIVDRNSHSGLGLQHKSKWIPLVLGAACHPMLSY